MPALTLLFVIKILLYLFHVDFLSTALLIESNVFCLNLIEFSANDIFSVNIKNINKIIIDDYNCNFSLIDNKFDNDIFLLSNLEDNNYKIIIKETNLKIKEKNYETLNECNFNFNLCLIETKTYYDLNDHLGTAYSS